MQISKYKINTVLAIAFTAILLFIMMAFRQSASAVTDTCTWTGATDNTFNDTGNWNCSIDGAAVPENGDTLEFDVSILTQNESLSNDIAGLSVAGINRVGDSASSYDYTVSGSEITLTGPITGTSTAESGSLIIALDLTLGSNVTFSNLNEVELDPITIFNVSTFDLTISAATSIYNVAGSGDITVTSNDSNYVTIGGTAGSYSGDVYVTDGQLWTFNNALGGSTTLTISGTGGVFLGSGTFAVPLTVGGTGDDTCWGPLNCSLSLTGTDITGPVTLTSDINVLTAVDSTISGTYTPSTFDITLSGGSTGTLTLPGNEVVSVVKSSTTITAADQTSATVSIWNGSTLVVNGERGDAYVYFGGTLKGTGNLTGVINVATGGTLAPGESPGCISAGAGLTLAGTFEVEIEGETVCTEYDQTDVTGTVNVTGGTLDLQRLSTYVPELNSEFVIINNDAADAVTGEFDGWAQGEQVVVDQVTYEIDYAGGDGNDVVLTVVAIDTSLVEEADAPDTGVSEILANPIVGLTTLVISGAMLVTLKHKELI